MDYTGENSNINSNLNLSNKGQMATWRKGIRWCFDLFFKREGVLG